MGYSLSGHQDTVGPFSLGTVFAFNVGVSHVYYFATDAESLTSEPCAIMVIVGDVESPSVICPANIVTYTKQLPTTLFSYDSLPPNSGLEVGLDYEEVEFQYDWATFMDNVVPVGDTDDLSMLVVTMKIKNGPSGSTRFIDDYGAAGYVAPQVSCATTSSVSIDPSALASNSHVVACAAVQHRNHLGRVQDSGRHRFHSAVVQVYDDGHGY